MGRGQAWAQVWERVGVLIIVCRARIGVLRSVMLHNFTLSRTALSCLK